MGYEAALDKAWHDVSALGRPIPPEVVFLADCYTVDVQNRQVVSFSCNISAKPFTAILILHYLEASLHGLPEPTGEWIAFKELSGVEGYEPAFRARSVSIIAHKYGTKPEMLYAVADRLPARKVDHGDVGIALKVFEKVEVLITIWRGDDEFGPEANLLFDRSISRIFCVEDIVVLSQMAALAI